MRMIFRKSQRREPAGFAQAPRSASAAPAAETESSGCAAEDRPAAVRGGFPAWLDLPALVGLFALIQLLVAFVLLFAGMKMPDAAALESVDEAVAVQAQEAAARFNLWAYPLTMGAMIGGTLLYRRLRGGNRSLGRYAVRGLNPALILWGMLLMTAAGIVLEPLLALLPEIPDFYGRGWRALLLTVVMAPLAEEFLCRGILLDAARARGGAVYGLFFSSVFFGVIHFHPAAVVNAFAMGLVLGYVYLRSESLWLAVILHAFNNASAMLLLTLGYAHTTLRELLTSGGRETLYAVVYAVSALLVLGAGVMVWRTVARLRREERATAGAQ